MATAFTKINSFVENLAKGLINLNGTLEVALTNTAHTATWDELADLTLCANHANTSSKALTVSSCAQTAGTLKLVLADLVLTATGACGPFQYIYIFDQASTGDKLIGYYDYGSAVTLALNDTFTLDFDPTNGVLTLA